jgi:hypothetical protein|nr:MAG TPA: AAA domain protein [Caudoviricetes sp.]
MGIPVIVAGRSGTGKSTSMRGFGPQEIGLINVIGKPLPFRGALKPFETTDYAVIKEVIANATVNAVVIDDAGYLITDMFMTRHASAGAGNGVFALYNDIGDSFYNLIRFIASGTRPDMVVYLMMHEDADEMGRAKIKTIGKLLDEKVTIEGMVSIVLQSECEDGKYVFRTNGPGICKSPVGMFPTETIPNDLVMVDDTIRDYWGLGLRGDYALQKERQEGINQ